MLFTFGMLALALYFFFLVDWKVFGAAFRKGGWVALGIYCLIGISYALVSAHLHTGMHH
jgi:hypothetical protein